MALLPFPPNRGFPFPDSCSCFPVGSSFLFLDSMTEHERQNGIIGPNLESLYHPKPAWFAHHRRRSVCLALQSRVSDCSASSVLFTSSCTSCTVHAVLYLYAKLSVCGCAKRIISVRSWLSAPFRIVVQNTQHRQNRRLAVSLYLRWPPPPSSSSSSKSQPSTLTVAACSD